MKYQYTRIAMAKIRNTDNPKCWGVYGAMGACSFPVGMKKMKQPIMENSLAVFYKTKLTLSI